MSSLEHENYDLGCQCYDIQRHVSLLSLNLNSVMEYTWTCWRTAFL